MVYAQYIYESKHSRISRNLNRGKSYEKIKPMFKKRDRNKGGSIFHNVKYKRGSSSQGVKSSCAWFGKRTLGNV